MLMTGPIFHYCESCQMPRACAGVRRCAKAHAADTAADWALERAAEAIADHNVRLRTFLLRLLDPEDLGHAVTREVRNLAREQLSMNPRAGGCPPCNGNCRQGRDCPAR